MEGRDPLTERIIACCYRVHSELGPGFNEKTYHNALMLAFNQEGLKYETEKRDVFKYQVLSYLRASKLKVGLLVNFGNKSCQVKRLVF